MTIFQWLMFLTGVLVWALVAVRLVFLFLELLVVLSQYRILRREWRAQQARRPSEGRAT